MKKYIAYIILGLALLVVARGLKPTKTDSAFDIDGFAELPVQVGGRIKPLDSVARNTLLILASRQKVVTPDGETLTPIEWFMDLTMRPELADTYRIFKIEFPDDLGLAGLSVQGQRYYSFNELQPHFEELLKLYNEVDPEPKKRNAYEQQIVDINGGLTLYHRVMHSLHPIRPPEGLDSLIDEYKSYQTTSQLGVAELRKQQAGNDYDAELLSRFINYSEDYMKLSQTAYLRVVPPPQPAEPLDDWKNVGLELLDSIRESGLSPYVTDYAALTMSYRAGDAEMFNQTIEQMRQRFMADYSRNPEPVFFERWFSQLLGKDIALPPKKHLELEHAFNDYQLFYISMQLYVLVFLVVCVSWLRWPKELGKAALWTLLIAFTIHTVGLILRMYLQGRPPVTNLYSSAVFVGWGAVLLGAFIEKFFKNGIGAAMASLVGFCTLIIAHHLAMSGDTLEMMRAVLDSNFWLATHVVIITFGYSAMFFAGSLALIFIVLGLFRKRFDKQTAKSLSSMVYGITCFATLFSLVGTILGGIWADQSWGRFWGWDPKENGALMIVIMGAIFLHARWGGICKERGLMALAICGNIITAWSWFGTNLLGVGLHSYGFTDSGFLWLSAFWLSQLFFIGLGLLPWRFWRSDFGADKWHKQRRKVLIAAEALETSEQASV